MVLTSLADTERKRSPSYQPVLLVAIAGALGIFVDRALSFTFLVWIISATGFLIGWASVWRRHWSRLSSTLLMLSIAALAGGWHHYWWNLYASSEVSRYAAGEPRPVCLEGKLSAEPKWVAAPESNRFEAIPRGPGTRLQVKALKLRQGNRWIDVSGNIQCFVQGRLPTIANGSRVRLFGQLTEYQPPTNPGEFDFRKYYRGRRQLAHLLIPNVAAVQVQSQPGFPAAWIARIRSSLNRAIWDHVGRDRAPFASAILLGNRHQLDSTTREAFLISGTVHLLAISGLHVGILAGSILFLGRLRLLPRRLALLLTIAFVISYAWLVEFRPPVVRAAILISLFCLAKLVGRQGLSFNTLGLAALIVLLINPTQLVSVGAQLSFLAVASLAYFYPSLVSSPATDPIDRLLARSRPIHWKVCHWVWQRGQLAFLVSATVWFIALPLVSARFHIVAPIALLVNPLLILPLTSGLLCGFIVLLSSWWAPPLASLAGKGCDVSLASIEAVISTSEQIPFSHFWVAGPPESAIIIFYFGLAAFVFYPVTRIPRRWAVAGLLCWTSFGVVGPLIGEHWQRARDRELACTCIDVGHGQSVLMQMPDGRNVLYDCGSFGSARQSSRIISSVLWHHRIRHLDLVIISHADLDHYNALPGLMRRFSIGQVAVAPRVAQLSPQEDPQEDIGYLLDRLRRRGIPVRSLARGTTIRPPSGIRSPLGGASAWTMRVLSPPPSGVGENDNAESIVLSCTWNGHSLLLPGDIEKGGLVELLERELTPHRIAMMPHHGSRHSRPAEFLAWCQPQCVIVSGDEDDLDPETKRAIQQHEASCFHTAHGGAGRFVLKPNQTRAFHWERDHWQPLHIERP